MERVIWQERGLSLNTVDVHSASHSLFNAFIILCWLVSAQVSEGAFMKRMQDASLLSLGRSPSANESKRLKRAYCQYAAKYERRTHNTSDSFSFKVRNKWFYAGPIRVAFRLLTYCWALKAFNVTQSCTDSSRQFRCWSMFHRNKTWNQIREYTIGDKIFTSKKHYMGAYGGAIKHCMFAAKWCIGSRWIC